ncbi:MULTISPECIES: acyl-CoA dehydrogenase family protein [unclassified Caballeronia]|uniref:acyl-CoA dehydrogenase family protein n=1 Tax=unclassified Caballeronia TaxID=2646786 RepID=UPI00285F3001|nr:MULTISPECIES: acyl-CoA dehydrogenase family protein [unclassified Caballeronia]MDR5752692.1 acyl-CoA/acyl-ACP dehydrogenase [Caballeronia sp. LZ024]MDR5841334.1 acyl-CoA/acyl-ACP dehydrogenase [Caballeronia sp. LZ031]
MNASTEALGNAESVPGLIYGNGGRVPRNEAELLEAVRRVAAIAAVHVDAVDREARFPREAFEAMRNERLLSAMIPRAFGGDGLALDCVARLCEALAQACASTAMIYAMHQSQVACIVDHGAQVAWQRDLLARMVDEQLLLASATSEETIGGNMRTSACAVDLVEDAFSIEKLAPTISYGAYADCILVTARRHPDAPPSDQVLIVAPRDTFELEPRGTWDTLGMRGTCSEGHRLTARGNAEQILPAPFSKIADESMLPVSHTLWASVWIGVAADAVNRAHHFFRNQARGKPGALPPSASRLAQAVTLQRMMQARLNAALDAVAEAEAERTARQASESDQVDTPLGASIGLASDLNMLKLAISTTAIQVVQEALMICGMAGYKNDTEFSVGRHLRDLLSAPLMISNDRIELNTANLLLAQRHAVTGTN